MSKAETTANTNSQLIFISGRFRSGTSMLWNIFNQLSQYHTWYEPLHPNLLSHIKYVKPKNDHIGISDYWTNYKNLNELENFYSSKFGQSRFFLEKHEKWQELKAYIDYLIKNSADKIPVLQFNRMDLRLGWLKNSFPEATFINIHREPYPLWVSSRKHIKIDKHKDAESYPDAYDLMQWSADLSVKFPMLQQQNHRSGYFRHYFIWLLAQKLAKYNADIQLNLENDFLLSHQGVTKLAKLFNWDNASINLVNAIIKQPESTQAILQKHESYTKIEKTINNIFKFTGIHKLFPSCPLSTIKLEYKKNWADFTYNPETTIQELLDALKYQKDELTYIINSM